MYVERVPHKAASGKVYYQYLLRSSRREGKKTIKTTHQNITPWGVEVCEAIKVALSHKQNIHDIIEEYHKRRSDAAEDTIPKKPDLENGLSIGSIWLLSELARRLGITDALGDTREGRLALWQIIARTIDQGSRLSAARLTETYEIDFLRLETFNENTLYDNLDWIAENQQDIEQKLFKRRKTDSSQTLFLYDVTSSYFEGVKNELAAYGYNRDKKRGKMQIVAGLLCDADGIPFSVEVFEGNTSDPKTVHNQIVKASNQFRCDNVVFVGDRGMIKSPQQKELTEAGFDFITALTKPQIEKLIEQGSLQMELFDETIAEIIISEENKTEEIKSKKKTSEEIESEEIERKDKRYLLRRNPIRAKEICDNRESKLVKLRDIISKRNTYRKDHPKSKMKAALKHCEAASKRLKIHSWTKIETDEKKRTVSLSIDEEKLKEVSRLDGCYCLTTSLTPQRMNKESVHTAYKGLSQVEEAFRTCKTGHLELRPIYVRKAGRTRAHVFVVMLSYLLTQELRRCWKDIDITVEEGLLQLSRLSTSHMTFSDGTRIHEIPGPNPLQKRLFASAKVERPRFLPGGKSVASSKRKLSSRRKS